MVSVIVQLTVWLVLYHLFTAGPVKLTEGVPKVARQVEIDGPCQLQEVKRSPACHLVAAAAGAKGSQVIGDRNVVVVTARSDVVERVVRRKSRLQSEEIQVPISVAERRTRCAGTSAGETVDVRACRRWPGRRSPLLPAPRCWCRRRRRKHALKIEILRVVVPIGVERDIGHRPLRCHWAEPCMRGRIVSAEAAAASAVIVDATTGPPLQAVSSSKIGPLDNSE